MENTRRKNRLENYDYSRNGMYFVTICTKNRIKYLSDITWEYNNNNDAEIVGDAALGVPSPDVIIKPILKLSKIGVIVNENIEKIDEIYEYVSVVKYVIMPDHIHIILFISDFFDDKGGTPRAASPTKYVPYIINALKSISTKKIGYSIW